MNDQPDPYAILGVPPGATQAEISHAYRRLLRRHHPDTRAPNDQSHEAVSDSALRQVLTAYAVLQEPARRADYHRESKTSAHYGRRAPQQAPNPDATYDQPPIMAGPVQWHLAL